MDAIPLPILPLTLACLNLLSLGTFWLDKHRAGVKAWRIPERTLLFLALFGPFGALAGMLVFRHKTRHTKFLLVPLFVLVQILLFVYLFTPLFR
ncbi:MAG: DUF1294 domain-containing protein [Methanomicrobiales archaeon HGW-Methanomicrobiales-3]|jgi:uncharacterized membrane protein YsdA (DUF1294 family)|nr:MAG: DUF1294 domain-containing protein [Methanomicrobiales archaeon HGW-Methanomicrobiales-3]